MTSQAADLIPVQIEFVPPLPTVLGNADYHELRSQLTHMDALLTGTELEDEFIRCALEEWLSKSEPGKSPSPAQKIRFVTQARLALRCTLLLELLQMSYRQFSARLADSPLLQWFCGIAALDRVKVPSKSALQRYWELVGEEQLRKLTEQLLGRAATQFIDLELDEPIDLDAYFLDGTCLPTNIHFPVDWVLLRDGVRTLTGAIICIRKHGLKHRIEAPENFLKEINRLAMEMTHTRGKADSKKARKKVLRKMKKVVDVVSRHARRYRQIVEERWEETDWSYKEAKQVINRIDEILELLPKAKKQAHERIIGERRVGNAEKILSLYEPETRVIKRGKAGAEVEFGNTLLLGENPDGLIIDWQLYKEVPSDSSLVKESIARVEEAYEQKAQMLGGDRGFDSKANSNWLEERGTYNGICPKSPQKLQERLDADEVLSDCLRRRAQTEGRIAILKNRFFGSPLKAKGFEHRKLAVTWGVLTHNLWLLARMRQTTQRRREEVARAAAA